MRARTRACVHAPIAGKVELLEELEVLNRGGDGPSESLVRQFGSAGDVRVGRFVRVSTVVLDRGGNRPSREIVVCKLVRSC